MARKNALTTAPPYGVEQALRSLGANLRTARLRRNLTVAEAAEKIGTGPRAVMEAEKGKPGTSAAVYAALLWAYDLLDQMSPVGDPTRDEEGLALARGRERERARPAEGLGDDF